jgi:hypothetical protein
MGFLSKAFRKGMKKQVAQMPRRGGGFGNLGEAISQNARTRRYAPTYSQKRSFSARAYTDGQHA